MVMRTAWTIDALRRSKKLPKIETLMSKRAAKPATASWQQMYANATAWVAAGGVVRAEGDAP